MTNFFDRRKATQIKYEPSSSTFRHALQLITMQKGRLCCHIVINNFIVFQMQYVNMGISHEQIMFLKKIVSLCSMNSTLFTNQQERWCFVTLPVSQDV